MSDSPMPSPGRSNKQRVQTEIQGAAPFVPSAPTTGAEAAELWGMSQQEAQQTSMKVMRNEDGTRKFVILYEVPLLNWSLAETAREFGPGAFVVKPSGGAKKDKQFTIQVAEEYARRAGWATVEAPPSPSQVMGLQFAERVAQQGGVGPMGVMFEAVLRPIMERLDRLDKADRSQSEFDPMKFLEIQERMRGNARTEMIQTLELLGKIRGDKPIEDEGAGAGGTMWAGLGEGLGRALLTMVQPRASVPPAATHQQETQPVQTVIIPEGWTAQDLQLCGPLIEIMRGLSTRLLAGALMAPASDMADNLLSQIQDDAVPAVLKLAERARETSGKALEVIGQKFNTPYWVEVMAAIETGLKAEGDA